MTGLGLAMIVRNEEKVITRCLDSVREHIDYWTIMDTGSTDDTPFLVEAALHGIPGELIRDPWIDFGVNRTRLLDAAHAKTPWILALDADMTLETIGPYPDADAGMVHYTGPTDWAQALLLSGKVSWRYVGRTHEYVTAVTAGARTVDAPGWTVTHHADGGTRDEKYQRDLELLLPDAERDDPRSMFYVARTYEGMGDKDKAVEWFRRRAAAGGWDEEVFIAQLQVGLLTWNRVELARAAEMRPSRAEPWLYLAQISAEEEKYHEAVALAEHGLTIPYPHEDVLFVERWIYEWGLRLERSSAAWWAGDKDLCRADSLALLATPPEHIRERIAHNLDLCR